MALFKFNQAGDYEIRELGNEANAVTANGNQLTNIGTGTAVIQKIIGNIQKNETIHYATAGDWNVHELLEHLLKITGPAKVFLTATTMSERPVRAILSLIDKGLITELNCVFDLQIQEQSHKVMQLIQGITCRVHLLPCHASVLVIENDSWSLSNSGSALWTRNPSIEAGVISADPKVAQFHKTWIMRLIEDENANDT